MDARGLPSFRILYQSSLCSARTTTVMTAVMTAVLRLCRLSFNNLSKNLDLKHFSDDCAVALGVSVRSCNTVLCFGAYYNTTIPLASFPSGHDI